MAAKSFFNTSIKLFLSIFISFSAQIGYAQEICDNGMDDDNNGLIDLNDPACEFEIIDYQSIIPNPSFEDYNCCPSGPSQMDCVNDWSQASSSTSDYMNVCNWISGEHFPPPLPIPDGNACVRIINGSADYMDKTLNHKEYAGVCLNYSMQKDSLYVFELYLGFGGTETSPDFNISFYGATDCSYLPFSPISDSYAVTSDSHCPLRHEGFTLLTSKLISSDSGNFWKKIEIEIRPEEDIAAIVVGADCERIEPAKTNFYYLDNILQ